tara:strand:+ start:430 stop:666 length:237 start_codon:yes stop_codon:yes gene_type:complete
MSLYSKELKEAVIQFVKEDIREQKDLDGKQFDERYFPCELALSKKEYPKDYKNFKTDWIEEEDFLIEFEDMKIILNQL